jgi:hypothetical protein
MVVTYRQPAGLAKLWHKKPMMTLVVGKPVYSIESEPTAAAEEELKQAVQHAMEQMGEGEVFFRGCAPDTPLPYLPP